MIVASGEVSWERLVDALSCPVAVLGPEGEPYCLNEAARALLGERPQWLDFDGVPAEAARLPWACAVRGERAARAQLRPFLEKQLSSLA